VLILPKNRSVIVAKTIAAMAFITQKVYIHIHFNVEGLLILCAVKRCKDTNKTGEIKWKENIFHNGHSITN
jgi:hypothetical protein